MELLCGQLLQNKLQFKEKVFNHGTRQETLFFKGVSRKFKRGVDWKKFKNEKLKKKETCYNCGIKNHFANECHKKKQNWKNKFKGFSHVVTMNKIKLLVTTLFIYAKILGSLTMELQNISPFEREYFQPLKNSLWVTKYILETTIQLTSM
jgi:hypothetical protein